MTEKIKVKPVCKACGSDEISLEVLASWDQETQQITVDDIMDKGHQCCVCDGDCSIGWVPV